MQHIQKWVDGFEEARKARIDRNIGVLSGLEVYIKGGNYNTILRNIFFITLVQYQ